MQNKLECSCLKQSSKVTMAAKNNPRSRYSVDIIDMLLKKTGTKLPSKIFHNRHVINERALATMLGNPHDRTKVGRTLQGDAGERLVASVGFCQACLKEIKPLHETPSAEMVLENRRKVIQETLELHPEVQTAEVDVWKDTSGNGLAKNVGYSKNVFSATLTLINGCITPFITTVPSRCPVAEFDGKVIEFQSKDALWKRIKNRLFIETENDQDTNCFKQENGRKSFENQIRQRYAKIRNISEKCLQVRLLTAKDVVPEARVSFSRQCVDKNRYVCEVTTRVPDINGLPGPVMQLEHISLRDLNETPNKRNSFDTIRNQFISIQKRYVQPLREFEWYMDYISHGEKPRRKVYFKVGSGMRCGGYLWEINKPDKNPPKGLRYFSELSSDQKYLSLVEVYDQQTGETELKLCLTQDHRFQDRQGGILPHDYNNLYSIIQRYRGDAGTAQKVKRGGKRYYQVRKVLAYCHGDWRIIQALDTLVKSKTIQYQCPPHARDGKTEFRDYQAKELCLEVLFTAAQSKGLNVVEPESCTIPWDLFIGTDSFKVGDWVLNRF
ncbi:MAG: hypothetical protein J0665_04180 [Deltaproteobacteria bacterium]|nr:hypothetical protein [Deltaproteobacteria bacterium]